MLYSLSVSNYILIGSLETVFPEGLIIISGETGAGKSILLGALSLVLGAKADASMVGPAGENCVVEAEFGMDEAIRRILSEADLPAEGDRLILRRTVGKSGRSRSFANDEPVSVSVLQELSEHLVDIHSQHQTLRLQDARFRMEALDLRAGCTSLRQACTDAWNQVTERRRSLQALEERLTEARGQQDYNESRWQRLEEAKLVSGELEDLEAEQKQLAHAEEIRETLSAADALLSPDSDDIPSPEHQLRECVKLLEKASRFVPAMETLAERLSSARLELEDIAVEVASATARIDVSPERLQAVEDRLSLLYGLFQKYGATSVEELIAERDRLSGLVMDATGLEAQVEEARRALTEAEKAHGRLCDELHQKRVAGAGPFAQAVEKLLHGLDLDKASFEVVLEASAPAHWAATRSSSSSPLPDRSRPMSQRRRRAVNCPASCWPSRPKWPASSICPRWCSTKLTPAYRAVPPTKWGRWCAKWAAACRSLPLHTCRRWRPRDTPIIWFPRLLAAPPCISFRKKAACRNWPGCFPVLPLRRKPSPTPGLS